MKTVKVLIKTPDGKMGFADVEWDDEGYPDSITTSEGEKYEQVDWCGQFNGPSIPVYEQVED